jgi:hypothetical protein
MGRKHSIGTVDRYAGRFDETAVASKPPQYSGEVGVCAEVLAPPR